MSTASSRGVQTTELPFFSLENQSESMLCGWAASERSWGDAFVVVIVCTSLGPGFSLRYRVLSLIVLRDESLVEMTEFSLDVA